jgi:outer membrane cobalamin receptor
MTTLFQGNNGTIWGGLPSENIARIEIIRGPGSALYGADALAGVIDIITKTSSEIGRTKVGVRCWIIRVTECMGSAWGKAGGVDIAAYLNVGTTNGHKRVLDEDAQTLRDRIAGTRSDLGFAPRDQVYLRASWAVAYGRQLNSQLTWVANRARSAGDSRPPVAEYKTFDLRAHLEPYRMTYLWPHVRSTSKH